MYNLKVILISIKKELSIIFEFSFMEKVAVFEIIFILLLLFCLLFKLQFYCKNELYKYHLYKLMDSARYYKASFTFKGYSFVTVTTRLRIFFWNKLRDAFPKYHSYFDRYILASYLIPNLFKYHALFLFIVLFIFELCYNNYCLHLIFYLLPIIVIYNYYFTLSDLVDSRNGALDRIIFERFYSQNCIYINLSLQEEKDLVTYILLGYKYRKGDHHYFFHTHPLIKKRFTYKNNYFFNHNGHIMLPFSELKIIEGSIFTMYFTKKPLKRYIKKKYKKEIIIINKV